MDGDFEGAGLAWTEAPAVADGADGDVVEEAPGGRLMGFGEGDATVGADDKADANGALLAFPSGLWGIFGGGLAAFAAAVDEGLDRGRRGAHGMVGGVGAGIRGGGGGRRGDHVGRGNGECGGGGGFGEGERGRDLGEDEGRGFGWDGGELS